MSLSNLDSGAPHSSSEYDVEYRSKTDDAWYSVRTLLSGEKLTVKYYNFCDVYDDVFEPQDFKTVEEIEEFKKRFRSLSVQLQDSECRKVAEGTVVCVSHFFSDFDVRFYDAVVDGVIYKDHSFVNGEERCMCTFVVIWEHGPIFGCLANKKVENICVIQSNTQLDPKVAKFSKIVMDRLESAAYEPNLPSSCGTPHEDIASLPVKLDSTFSHRFSQASVSCIRCSGIYLWKPKTTFTSDFFDVLFTCCL
ncbi:hypothetical protein P3X46_018061 [Hevea brasiliensis]|uniref:SAWADEE domain-containing protein n=1 Tax=Hevea brasiliensis TaxID=3981 RepID=A0ABQ9LRK3_HEVBR|nr:hypothetical protein P3X46_018061 [Hevea brasiliensis]